MGAKVILTVALCLVWLIVDMVLAEENYQQWSEQSYIDEPFSFYCNDTLYPVFVNPDDNLIWRRHGHDAAVKNDDHFELGLLSGIQNMKLTIKMVTDEMSGIYFCEIYGPSGDFVGRIVKGLNIGGHKYHDFLDKYQSHVITGVITAASVLFVVLSVCAIDHFRYVSPEDRLEKLAAKEERYRQKGDENNGGYDNLAIRMNDFDDEPNNHANNKFQNEINTHF